MARRGDSHIEFVVGLWVTTGWVFLPGAGDVSFVHDTQPVDCTVDHAERKGAERYIPANLAGLLQGAITATARGLPNRRCRVAGGYGDPLRRLLSRLMDGVVLGAGAAAASDRNSDSLCFT